MAQQKKKAKSKSVSPKGFTLPNAERRLNETPVEMQAIDAEHIITKLWEEENTRQTYRGMGLVPLDTILHVCNEKCGLDGRPVFQFTGNHSYDGQLNERDVRVAAATIQWLATSVGRGFFHNFLLTLDQVTKTKKPKGGE